MLTCIRRAGADRLDIDAVDRVEGLLTELHTAGMVVDKPVKRAFKQVRAAALAAALAAAPPEPEPANELLCRYRVVSPKGVQVKRFEHPQHRLQLTWPSPCPETHQPTPRRPGPSCAGPGRLRAGDSVRP